MPQPWKPDLTRQADGVLLRGPQRVGGNGLLCTEPIPTRCAVTGPVQAGVIGEDLDPRANDEGQQEQVEEVLDTNPDRNARALGRDGLRRGTRVAIDEPLHDPGAAHALRSRDCGDEHHQPDGPQPQEIEPTTATDPNPRGNTAGSRHRARPGVGINDVLASRQLRPVLLLTAISI